MLGLERKACWCGPQEHLRDFDPVPRVLTAHQGFQVVSTSKERRPPPDVLGHDFKQADRDIATEIAQPFQKKAPERDEKLSK